MIKPRCPGCNYPYLEDDCPWQEGRHARRLECDCGNPAVEVWDDELGEWPLCEDCLRLAQDEFAPLPLPDHSKDVIAPVPAALPVMDSEPAPEIPYGLTQRELQIARLSYMTNE